MHSMVSAARGLRMAHLTLRVEDEIAEAIDMLARAAGRKIFARIHGIEKEVRFFYESTNA